MNLKFLKPKVLAIIAIVAWTSCLFTNICTNIFADILFSGGRNSILPTILSILIQTLIFSAYTIIYLSIIVFVKNKNVKVLNIILLIQFIINIILNFIITLSQIIPLLKIHSMSIPYMSVIQLTLSIIIRILSLISPILMLIIVLGIILKKKFPYKVIMIISISLLFTNLILSLSNNFISILSLIRGEVFLRYLPINILSIIASIFSVVYSCSFTLFMYQYGKSISERSRQNG